MAQKIVEYDAWCSQCKYDELPETDEPCCDCLNEPYNTDSRKPVCFEADD